MRKKSGQYIDFPVKYGIVYDTCRTIIQVNEDCKIFFYNWTVKQTQAAPDRVVALWRLRLKHKAK